MRAIPDRWNPWLWLRVWLFRSTPTERTAAYQQLVSRVVARMDDEVRRGTSVLNRQHSPGWSIARLAEEFGLQDADAANRLREAGVMPVGTRGETEVYRLSDAAPALVDIASVMRHTRPADTMVVHLDKASAEAYSASRIARGQIARSQIVCAVEGSAERISPALWERILAKHRVLGRQLTEEEVRALCSAEPHE